MQQTFHKSLPVVIVVSSVVGRDYPSFVPYPTFSVDFSGGHHTEFVVPVGTSWDVVIFRSETLLITLKRWLCRYIRLPKQKNASLMYFVTCH